MHVPLILATLIVCIALIVRLRLRWPRLSSIRRRRLTSFAVVYLFLFPIALFTGFSTTLEHINALIYWGFICSYVFLVILLTLFRPFWFTTLIAIVLILPLLSASVFLPLGAVFSNQTHHVRNVGYGLVSDLEPIDAITAGASGADLSVYKRRFWAPFFQKKAAGTRYFNTQCDTTRAYVIPQPERHGILFICPAHADLSLGGGREYLFPYNFK